MRIFRAKTLTSACPRPLCVVKIHSPDEAPLFVQNTAKPAATVDRVPDSLYEGVSKSFRTEPIMEYTLTTINAR
jgi:hypothetical protein